MSTTYKLADVDGQLCVKWMQREYDKPETIETSYPTGWTVRDWHRLFPEYEIAPAGNGPEVYPSSNGEYVFKANGFSRTITLAQYGRTLPVKLERVPIQPPKCKLPLRYRNGRWEKETKRGFVPV